MNTNTYKQQRLEEFRDEFGLILAGTSLTWQQKSAMESFLLKTIDDMDKKVEEAKTQVREEMIEKIEKDFNFYIDRYEYRGNIKPQEAKEQTMSIVRTIIHSLKEGSK